MFFAARLTASEILLDFSSCSWVVGARTWLDAEGEWLVPSVSAILRKGTTSNQVRATKRKIAASIVRRRSVKGKREKRCSFLYFLRTRTRTGGLILQRPPDLLSSHP